MLRSVISGGQTGAELGAWKAARDFGVRTFGFMLPGYANEAGRFPEYKAIYDAREIFYGGGCTTKLNLNSSYADSTMVFGIHFDNARRDQISADCLASGSHAYFVNESNRPSDYAKLIWRAGTESLFVTGARESERPGIEANAFDFMMGVFEGLRIRDSILISNRTEDN